MKIKYLSLIISVMLSASLMTACGSDTEKNETSGTSNSSVSGADGESSEADDETVLASNDKYTVTMVKMDEDIYYAQISEMDNETVQSDLNEKFKSLEESRYERTHNYTAKPVILFSDEKILCINQTAYFGEDEDSGSSQTVLSINMENGEELELSDVTDIDALAEKIFNNDGITVVSDDVDASIEDFLEEHYFTSADDVKKYLETYGKFSYNENSELVIRLSSSAGIIEVIEK